MKSIVSSLVLAAVLVSTGINAAPAAVSDVLDARAVEGAVAPATHAGHSIKPAVHEGLAHSEKKDSSLSGHGAHKQHTLSTSHQHTKQHGPKKDKKRHTKKHHKTQNGETEKQSKEHVTVSHNTPSTSHTEASANRLSNHKSDAQPRDISEAAEAVYARDKKSKKAKKAKKSRKSKKLRKAKESVQPATEASQESNNTPTMTTREFEEGLEARLFDHLKQKMREAKAKRLQKAAAKAQAKAEAAAIKAGVTPLTPTEHATRDLFEDDLDMRDLLEEEFEARDILEDFSDIEARDRKKAKKLRKVVGAAGDIALDFSAREYFDEELDARSFGDFFRALTHRENAKEKAARLQREADLAAKNAAAAAAEAGIGKREYIDDELEMREFYDDEDLLARDYFDESELAARDHNIWQTLNAITHTFAPATPAAHAPAAAPADGEPKAREVFDEFDLRDFMEVDELD